MSASAGPRPGVGILGAGRAGTALARALQRAGIPAWIASTRSPTSMRFHLAQYAPRATAVAAEQIGQQTGGSGPGRPDGLSIVVLMVPQEDLDSVDPGWLDGVLLVDATNRWEDEPLPDWFEDSLQAGLSSSEAIAARFPGSTVVKTLNHLSHWDLDGGGQRVQPRLQSVSGDPANMGLQLGGAADSAPPTSSHTVPHQRRALGIASDDGPAASRVAHLIDALGFDPVVLPSLRAGVILEPGGPVFNRSWTAGELADLAGGSAAGPSADGTAQDR